MAGVKERLTALLRRLRDRHPWLDHTLAMLAHYSAVNGNGQAGAVTFFGFLSVFPILALAFFVVGLLAQVYPDIRAQMVAEINNLLPGMIGSDPGEIPLRTVEESSGRAGIVGLVGVLYSGLGWLSGMRMSLEAMFVVPRREQPSFVFGKLRDLGTLGLIGVTLIVSVVLSGAVNGFTGLILAWWGVDPDSTVPAVLLNVVGHALAIAASTVLLLTMYKLLLVDSHVPRPALVRGALLGAVGFEILKLAANLLLGQTKAQPAFQAFGVALILVVWINYFSRLVMYAAAWSYTSPLALAQRTAEATRAPGATLSGDAPLATPAGATVGQQRNPWILVAGGAAAGAAAALAVRGGRR